MSKDSKIPTTKLHHLRRQSSLRLNGEKVKYPYNNNNNSDNGEQISIRFLSTKQAHCDAFRSLGNKRSSLMDERSQKKGSSRPDNIVGIGGTGQELKGTGTGTPSPARIRSLSLSLSNARLQSPKSPRQVGGNSPINPSQKNNYSSTNLDRWDTDSVSSIGSTASCDHASIARNGTTFSGKSMKYVYHCNEHSAVKGEDYLTPTQRAQKQVKKLKSLLQQAKKDLNEKDSDILRLTKEVVELRLYKAALGSPEDRSNSSDAVTVRENNTSEENTPDEDMIDKPNNSCSDSGHYEDCTNSSIHSKDSVLFDDNRSPIRYRNVSTTEKTTLTEHDEERTKLLVEYERRMQELVKMHEDESHQMKQKHNDKVEELLQRITEINNRYWQLVPELESAKERIKELEQQLEEASQNLEEANKRCEEHQKNKKENHGKSKIDREKIVMELAHQNPSRISVPELLQELQITKNELESVRDLEYASTSKNNTQPLLSAKEALSLWVLGARKAMYKQLMAAKNQNNKIDPEITLQFLKSAVYYFLTDKENTHGHLKAIQSILGFTQNEIANIDKAWFT